MSFCRKSLMGVEFANHSIAVLNLSVDSWPRTRSRVDALFCLCMTRVHTSHRPMEPKISNIRLSRCLVAEKLLEKSPLDHPYNWNLCRNWNAWRKLGSFLFRGGDQVKWSSPVVHLGLGFTPRSPYQIKENFQEESARISRKNLYAEPFWCRVIET